MATSGKTSDRKREKLAREIEDLLGLRSHKRDRNGERYRSYEKGTQIVQAVLKSIVDGLHRGETVTIRGFGTFIPVKRAPRKTPCLLNGNGHGATHTGGTITHPAKTVVTFRPSPSLSAWVNLDRNGELNALETRTVASWNLNGHSIEPD